MTDVVVPDLGDFTDVPVIEVLVAVGDTVEIEDPLVVLESDKASMDIPSTAAGVVEEVLVKVGDTVSAGTPVIRLGGTPGTEPERPSRTEGTDPPVRAQPQNGADPDGSAGEGRIGGTGPSFQRGDVHGQVVVLGSGPGGYTAAFRAADLGLDVVMVERYESLGGVCLNVGCIPSKALLHIAKVIVETEQTAAHGVRFGEPEVDLDELRRWKDGIVGRLTGGLGQMAKGRSVRVAHGEARFTGPHELQVGDQRVTFDHAIVAAGSHAVRLPSIPHDDPRVMDSTDALELADIPARLLVVGGGIIGLEMATVYDALGAEVTVVELADQLIPGCDPDLVKPLHKRIAQRYAAVHLNTRVEGIEARDDGLHATFSDGVEAATFDRVLVAVGRVPNGADLGLDAAGVHVDERGFVPVDRQQRTNQPHVFAIGDVVGQPMLAHKAFLEAKVAAEVIAGHDVAFDARGIPNVAYTEPEIAWVGLTETEAKAHDTPYDKAAFPWSASGRALASDSADGITKLLVDPQTRRVLGAGIVGTNAGELIAEPGFALELGADAEDLGLTIHPHPTLSESIALAAELIEGTITDLPPPRRRKAAGG